MRDYPIDLDYFGFCKKIVTIARKIDEIEHQLNKAKNETNWYDKHAKLLDIDLDDELMKENEVDNTAVSKSKNELAKKKNELVQLLRKPIFPKNFSHNYLASDNISRFRLVNSGFLIVFLYKFFLFFSKIILLNDFKCFLLFFSMMHRYKWECCGWNENNWSGEQAKDEEAKGNQE